ncbi:hypothetical protein [Streptomyces sp. N35]|uniref:hypothetical protein n=1 Tax=Streptomyces sp. N35 TaxID=2795730 RepID=UPI0018F6CB7E|nr:hypothetical protein [Streptomyces sp. N35]
MSETIAPQEHCLFAAAIRADHLNLLGHARSCRQLVPNTGPFGPASQPCGHCRTLAAQPRLDPTRHCAVASPHGRCA